jgi:hypothetical protein
MSKFVKLTDNRTEGPTWIHADKVEAIEMRGNNDDEISLVWCGGNGFAVKESPARILELIAGERGDNEPVCCDCCGKPFVLGMSCGECGPLRVELEKEEEEDRPQPALAAREGWRKRVEKSLSCYADDCYNTDCDDTDSVRVLYAILDEVREIDPALLSLPEPSDAVLLILPSLDDLTKNEKLQLSAALIRAAGRDGKETK